MAEVKAIETVFDGHRFRSRLEARWAVFFKHLGIPYEYELEGFEVGGGVRYLPDFYLPGQRVHVEVKPNTELMRADLEKMIRFAVDCDQQLLLILGTPARDAMFLVNRTCADSWDSFAADELEQSDEALRERFFEAIADWAHVQFGLIPRQSGYHLLYKTNPPMAEADIAIALQKAKQARFEHGRHGD